MTTTRSRSATESPPPDLAALRAELDRAEAGLEIPIVAVFLVEETATLQDRLIRLHEQVAVAAGAPLADALDEAEGLLSDVERDGWLALGLLAGAVIGRDGRLDTATLRDLVCLAAGAVAPTTAVA